MSIITEWDDSQKTVIRFSYSGIWTWTEFHASIDLAVEMAKDISHPIDHIYDVTHSSSLPSGALSQLRSVRNRAPVTIRCRVVVGASALVKGISQMMLKLYPNFRENFFVADTLEDAREFLTSLPKFENTL